MVRGVRPRVAPLDALRRSAELVAAYNALKQQFDGKPMDAYRSAKSAFVEDVLRRQAG